VSTAAPKLPSVWSGSVKAFIIVFILISLWDSVSGFLKSRS
jgi:hypothetical protein